MAFTQDSFYTSLIPILATCTGKTVIRRNQNGPRPAVPYVSALISDLEWPHISSSSATLVANSDYKVYRRGKCTVSIEAYGDDCFDVLTAMQAKMRSEGIQALFRAANITPLGSSAVLDISIVINSVWEKRATYDIVFSVIDVSAIDTSDGYFDVVITPEGTYE